jgi:hypothetical protein
VQTKRQSVTTLKPLSWLRLHICQNDHMQVAA